MMRYALEDLKRPRQNWLHAAVLALLAMAAAMNGQPVRADEIKIGGTGSALGTMQLLADAFHKAQGDTRVVVVPNLGSSGGIKAAISGAIQLGVSSRPLRESELGRGAKAAEYSRTPFVFVTSSKTRGVAAVTSQQLVDIYSGRMERWPDGTRIRIVLRPESDSDTDLVRGISPAVKEAEMAAQRRPGILVGATDHDSAGLAAKLAGSLGVSSLSFILTERPPLTVLNFNGVEPSVRALANGSYPLIKTMLFVTGPNAPPSAYKFMEFVRSPAGREILVRTGHLVI